MVDAVHDFVLFLSRLTGEPAYDVKAILALLMVAITCGVMGSFVIGNRMAFFSDAMAHTAMAGVTLALLGMVVLAGVRDTRAAEPFRWAIPLVMAAVGAVVAIVISLIQERTSLTSDTVIGVFFALALGFAGLLLPALNAKVKLPLEEILFGQLLFVDEVRLLMLAGMVVVTLLMVTLRSNAFLLGSFNPSLANSRGLPVRWDNYLFVALLAVVVNLSVYAVGVLLINALLVVPAAAAANVSANLRWMFWTTLAGCIGCATLGYRISSRLQFTLGPRPDDQFDLGPSGAVVMTCVGWFFLSLLLRVVLRRFFGNRVRHDPTTCSHDHDHGLYHQH
ncbi:MAG: metal ABC transporter permease [Fimbriiglobus sp.]|nr:metal ABC transporter permease [Fimbriiglobus sp.]